MRPNKNLLLLLLLIGLSASAQTKKPTATPSAPIKKSAVVDSSQFATVQVNVTDFSDKPKPKKGEQVSFLAKKTKKLFSSKTNGEGKCSVVLPVGDDYTVTIKALTDTSKYGELQIPALSEGQFYNEPFTVNIQYEAPRNFTLDHVYFDFGKATLRPESNKELQELFEYLKYKEEEKLRLLATRIM